MLPKLKLSKATKEQYAQIMASGNIRLKACADLFGMDCRSFRAKLFRGPFNPADWPDITPCQEAAVREALPHINAVRDIEWPILCGYSEMAYRYGKEWYFRFARQGNSVIDREDFVQEAMLAILDGIYTYRRPDVLFVTYAWWLIHNRMAKVANKTNPFGPLSNDAIQLLVKYEHAVERKMGPLNDPEIYEQLGWSPAEIKMVEQARTKLFHASQSNVGNDNNHTGVTDYTALRRGIDSDRSDRDTVKTTYELNDAIRLAELSPLEWKCVRLSMYPYYGWQAELARETINPKTGQAFSRPHINNILKKALRKVKAQYLRGRKAA